MMNRYELRQWTDSTHTEYAVKSTSNDVDALKHMLDKPSIPNHEWYRLHIVDTHVSTEAA